MFFSSSSLFLYILQTILEPPAVRSNNRLFTPTTDPLSSGLLFFIATTLTAVATSPLPAKKKGLRDLMSLQVGLKVFFLLSSFLFY
jgi:hypothetical protein